MNRAPFQPVGDRPKWEIVYDVLTGHDIGDTITYEEIADALGITREQFLTGGRPGWYKAMNRWGDDHKRALRPVNGVGYRVVEPSEHLPIAKNHHKRSKRQLRRARQVIVNADRSLLTKDERERFDRVEATLGRHEDMIRRLDGRTAKVEKAVAESKQQHVVTEERVSALEDALRRHGIDPDSPSSKAS